MYICLNSSLPGEIFYEWLAFLDEQPNKQNGLISNNIWYREMNDRQSLTDQCHIELFVLPCGDDSYKLPVIIQFSRSLR